METGQAPRPRGTVVANRYEIVTHLGTGELGAVYLARDTQSPGTVVVLKLFHPELSQDTVFAQRLVLGIQAMRLVRHPNVIQVFEAGNVRGECFYTMEYLKGNLLSDRIAARGEGRRWSWLVTSDLLKQICQGLQAIHAANLIHGDLRCENIFVDADHTIRLTDFGIASATRFLGAAPAKARYRAPELRAGGLPTKLSDLYSLGVIFHELLTGRSPDELSSEPVDYGPDVPEWAHVLLQQLLARRPEHRLKSVDAALAVLDPRPQAHPESPFTAAPSSVPPQPGSYEEVDLSDALRQQLSIPDIEVASLDVHTPQTQQQARELHTKTKTLEYSSEASLKASSLELDKPRKFRTDSMRMIMRAFGKSDPKDDAPGAAAATLRSKSLRMMLRKRGSGSAPVLEFEDGPQKRISLRFLVDKAQLNNTKVLPPKSDYRRVAAIGIALVALLGCLAYPRLSYLFPTKPTLPIAATGYRVNEGELAAVERFAAHYRLDFGSPDKVPYHFEVFQKELGILLPPNELNYFRGEVPSDPVAIIFMTMPDGSIPQPANDAEAKEEKRPAEKKSEEKRPAAEAKRVEPRKAEERKR